MAARQARRYAAEGATIVMDIPEDSDISDFEEKVGDREIGIDKSNTDSDESDNSASDIEHAKPGDSCSDVMQNETTISTKRQSSRGKPREEEHVEVLQEERDPDPLETDVMQTIQL